MGTPAEESGGGKVLLLERGVFDDVAMAMMVHPALEESCASSSLAITDLQLHHTGTAAHAAAAPDIVPANTSPLYYLRVRDVDSLRELETRGWACFEAGGLATGCAHEVTQVSPICTQLVPDAWFAAAYRTAITGLGRSPLSPEDEQRRQTGSTDMGNVFATLPAIHPTIAIHCGDAVNHEPEFATAGVMPSADRAVCDGALALALTALAAATDDAQRDRLIGGMPRRHTVSRPPSEVHYDRAGFPSRHAAPPSFDFEQPNRDVVDRRAD